jgi:hypothetical protein
MGATMSGRTNEPATHPLIRVDGRVLAPTSYRPTPFVDLEDSVAWWTALSILGAFLALAGVLIGSGEGEATAIGGVALFFATAVSAGAERAEIASALGTAGVVWTALGIAVVLGTDTARVGSLLGLAVSGGAFVAAGAVGALRAGRRRADAPRDPTAG